MELLIGHLKFDVLILDHNLVEILDEGVDWTGVVLEDLSILRSPCLVMELLIGHLKLDVLILFFDNVDERVDWRLCRGLHLRKVQLEVTTLNPKQITFAKSWVVKLMSKPSLEPESSQSSNSSKLKMTELCLFLVSVVHISTTVFSFLLMMASIASM